MKNQSKKINQSIITMTELVLPNNTNQLGKLLGGQLMHWIDICAALCAIKHSQFICVTASVDRLDFHHSINLGDAVTLVASINRVFNTSMEVGVKVFSESYREGTRIHTNSAYLTFVSIDNDGKPVKAIQAIPETDDEKRRYEEALQRREARLKNRSI
ncbi:MAG: acyl-CoA thioesterase [Ignavibacteriaceae bacterium]